MNKYGFIKILVRLKIQELSEVSNILTENVCVYSIEEFHHSFIVGDYQD